MKKFLTLLLIFAMLLSMLAVVSCNSETPEKPDGGNDQPGTPSTDPETPPEDEEPGDDEISEDQEEADKVIERINKITEITIDTWKDNENKIEYARKYYEKLTDAQKALISDDLVKKLEEAEVAYAAFLAADEKAKELTVNKIVLSSPRIDGSLEGYYVMGSVLKAGDVKVHFTYDKTYLYIFAVNNGGTDAVTVQLTRNNQVIGGVILSMDGVSAYTDNASSAAKADYPYQATPTDGGFTAEVAITMEDLNLDRDHFEDKEIGASFVCGDLKYTGFDDPTAYERFFTADSAHYNYIASGTPTIDGEMDELYLDAHAITLSQAVVNSFSPAEQKLGGGWQGDTSMTDSADMHTTFRFAVDDEYLYIVEHRFDYYPVWGSDSFQKPFRADGSLLWFSKNDNLGAGIQWNRALKNYAGPVFGLFFGNGQSGGVEKNWEFAIKQYLTSCEYIMEVKVPLADLELTRKDFDDGKISFTFCSADVVNLNYDATNFQWDGTAYQMNYIGVNTWGTSNNEKTKMPMLLVNTSGEAMSEMPELTGDWAPDMALEFDTWNPDKGSEPRPFDTFPVDAETGYLKTEWQRAQLDAWYEKEYDKKTVVNFNRTALPEMPEGVTLITVNNPSRNANAGFYCDPIGSYAGVSIDLTKYKDAMITLATGQNYVLEVSTDGENWTELYNYTKLNSTPTKDTTTFYGYAIDSTVYADGAETIYVRIGQSKTNETGWGGTLQGITVFYN